MVYRYISIVFKLVLAILFVVSAIAKLSEIETFAQSLNSYKLLSPGLVPFFSYYVPLMELGLAVGFLLPRFDKVICLLTIAVMLVFQVALASLIIRGIDIDCGCFGKFASTPGLALLRNFVILAMCSLLLFAVRYRTKLQNRNQD